METLPLAVRGAPAERGRWVSRKVWAVPPRFLYFCRGLAHPPAVAPVRPPVPLGWGALRALEPQHRAVRTSCSTAEKPELS